MKINQFPGLFSIGRKDSLWEGYRRMQKRFGEDQFNFHAKTFVLPGDRCELERAMESRRRAFIMKPPNWYCGIGIKLVNDFGKILYFHYNIKYVRYLTNKTRLSINLVKQTKISSYFVWGL